MAKKSILYIITKSVWGGAAKYVYDLATNLSDEFEINIAAGGQGKFAQKIKKANLPYFEIKNFQRWVNIFKDLLAGFEILFLLFKLKPDIIHVNSSKAGGLVGKAIWYYKLFSRRKACLIFTVHGWAFNEDRPGWQIGLIKLFSKLTALFYDKIICVSEYDRKTALKNSIAPADKLITIHNGIDAESISFLPREEAQKKLLGKASPLVVGTIAEWTKNKGLLYLLEAAKTIPANFILIGSGENPDKEKLERYIKRHNLKNIYLREWIDNAASYLKAFDIFILPSVKEGLPYTILEAMTAEVPVIATKVGGIPEMIKNNAGILIQSKNSQQLAEKIIYLINNPEIAQEMTQRAKEKVVKEFSLEKMLKKTKRLYL
ncbi:MAG: glycosyltransferase family 4 protein [Candidatus Portnoybacteria bacterium]|nr:glycosyltransferase family 4 protein [Candidatus Portnoybacteria bacterium]